MSDTVQESAPHAQCSRPMPLDTAAQLKTLLTAAGLTRLEDRAWLRVTGEDRVRWLNGMVTNSIQALQLGEGSYSFALNAQGRIQADLYAYAQPEALLVQSDRARMPELIALLDHYIIMDDVELTDLSATLSGLAVDGPGAAALLAQIGLPVESLAPLHLAQTTYQDLHVTLLHAPSPLVPRYEIWAEGETLDAILNALELAGGVLCTAEATEQLRLLEGTPLYGVDIRDKDLPQETAQTQALHFAKGCYLGQEIVERIRSRGSVHRALTGFQLTGDVPACPAGLTAVDATTGDAKPIGELTSAARITLPDGSIVTLALGIVRREAVERAAAAAQPLSYPGGTASSVTLPFAAASNAAQTLE